MKRKPTLPVLVAAACAALLAWPASASLVNRYSFNEAPGTTTVKDAIGSADGVIKGNGADYDGAGQLVLPGGGASADAPDLIAGYADLPNHIINIHNQVTIETWVTWQTSGSSWQRVFDFGTSAGGEDVVDGGGAYLFMSPQGDTKLRFAVRDPVTGTEFTQLTAATPLDMGTEVCLTATYDPAANTARLYSNAVLLVTGPAPVALKDINDVNNWLGRSQWNDPMFAGSYNEFRIYDTALNPVEVAASFTSGTETPSTDSAALGALQAVHLTVLKTTMTVQDVLPTSASVDYAKMSGITLIGVPGVSYASDKPEPYPCS